MKYRNKLKQDFYDKMVLALKNKTDYFEVDKEFKEKGLSCMARQAVRFNINNELREGKIL